MFAISKFEEDIRKALWIIIETSKGESYANTSNIETYSAGFESCI
jgi:hypothetical protein